ncbi:MAG: sulfurtransferase [Ilumatobacter sp.]|nr:sulfurtransferase [Ilumatobacter sp.]
MTLISVAELADRIDDEQLVVCDVRFHLDDHERGRRDYESGHVRGARFVDLPTELAAASGDGGGRHPLPSVEAFADVLGRLGIEPRSSVVAYDDAGGATASRLWWMLRSIGHGQVAVLDGGIQAWVAAGHELSTDTPSPVPTVYPPPPGWTGVVDADAVEQSLSFGGTVIDARAPERFRGEHEPIDARAGHIPGAINRFHGDTIGDDGLHRPMPELVELFAGVGTNPVVYCGSGVTACHDLLVLSTIGLPGGRLYPGSWSEWSADSDRPVATGD